MCNTSSFFLAEVEKPKSELEARFAKLHDKKQSPIALKPKPKVPPPVSKKPLQHTSSQKPTTGSNEESPIQPQRVEPVQMNVKLFDDGNLLGEEVTPRSVKKDFANVPFTFDSTLPFSSESESENDREPPVEEVLNAKTIKESPETIALDKILAVEPQQKSSSESSSDEESDHVYEANITPGPSEDSYVAQAIQTKVADLLLSSDEEEPEEKKFLSESSSDNEDYEELHSEPRDKERAPSMASSEDGYLTPDEVKRKTEDDHGEYLTPKEVSKGSSKSCSSGSSSSSSSSSEEDKKEALENEEVTTDQKAPPVRGAKPIAPKIIVPLDDFTCKDGEDVFFEVEFVASPKPEVLWYLDDSLIHHSDDFEILVDSTSSSLFIQEAFPDDSGHITVTVKNSEGEASCSACLTIEGRVCV